MISAWPVRCNPIIDIQMGQLLIAEGALFHQILREKIELNQERSNEVRNFANNIVEMFGLFSTQITTACRKFFKKLKVDQTEDEGVIFLSKYIIDILNELSKKIGTINKKIEIDVVQPLALFIQNQNRSHSQTLAKSQQLLYSIQSNSDLLKELKRNFSLNQLSLSKTQSQKQLLKDIVSSQIQRCNTKWQQIQKAYIKILEDADSYNSIRCNFTVKLQITIVKLINRLVNSSSIDESLQDYEEIYAQNQTFSVELKDQMRDKLGKLLIFQDLGDTSLLQIVSSQSQFKQKQLIDDFIAFFISGSALDQDEKGFQQSRTLILEEMKWTHYFLNKLKNSLYTELTLNNLKFRQLATIIKYIFAIIVQVESNEGILYNLLYISSKVRHKDQYLIRQLGKHEQFWTNASLWQDLLEYVREVKTKGKNGDQFEPQRRHRFKKLFSRSTWTRSKHFLQLKIRSQKVIQDSRAYEILCQINYYMAKLQLQQIFIFDFMTQQATKFAISKDNIRKILEYHYMSKMIATNKVSSNSMIRKARLQERYKNIKNNQQKVLICVGMAINYLPSTVSLSGLLLVSKKWNQYLQEKILRKYLIYDNNFSLLDKHRLKLYLVVCHPPFTSIVYERMIEEVPEFTQHSELIHLDARRSLGWDQKLRVQMIEVLKAFSYYHPDNGYLQGMNYLCQNILKMTDDSYTCYSIFQHLMNNQYYQLYTGNFDGLKLKIYQFMRILQRERPQLYEHLRVQKLQGQHFLLSWAITLWGQTSGQLCWILWDGFIVEGWPWWFKSILWLLKVLEAQLLKMNFQQIMKCFSDLHSTLFSYALDELKEYAIDKNKIKEEINSIKIEKDVLVQIEKQYKLKSNMINQYLKNVYSKKK